jgi:ABC-type polysaccharide/polyol phosphate export permease
MLESAPSPRAGATARPIAPAPVKRTIVATKRRIQLSDIWTTIPVARITALRDMRIKYKQSLLGPVWLVIQPLGLLAAVCVAFAGVTQVDTGGIPYGLFALVGVTVWTYTQVTITVATQAMLSNYTIVRRSACPRIALLHGSMLSNLPTLGIMTAISLLAAIVLNGARWEMLLFPLLGVWLFLVLWGPSLLLSAVATRYRDAIAIIPLLMQAGTFLSPVGYPIQSAPHYLQVLLWINPLTGVIETWRWAILGSDPAIGAIFVALGWTVVLGAAGWRLFGRMETAFADFL